MMRRGAQGLSYVEVMVSTAGGLLLIMTLSAALIHGLRLSAAVKARTQLLNAAQAEMERIRGIPFERLESYAVNGPGGVAGKVRVETVAPRRKQVSVLLGPRGSVQRVELVTYVHEQGLNP
jgi:Tfp pilus assembly protein PilV